MYIEMSYCILDVSYSLTFSVSMFLCAKFCEIFSDFSSSSLVLASDLSYLFNPLIEYVISMIIFFISKSIIWIFFQICLIFFMYSCSLFIFVIPSRISFNNLTN